jgi:hypothetical protein
LGGTDHALCHTTRKVGSDAYEAAIIDHPIHELCHHTDDAALKVGSDAYKAAIIDLCWNNSASTAPTVSMRLETVTEYEKDLAVEAVAFNAEVRPSSLSVSQHTLATTVRGGGCGCIQCRGTVRVFDRKLRSMMPLVPTPLLRVKLLHACDHNGVPLGCPLPYRLPL